MKSILVNYADLEGGAAIAAYRIHHALRSVDVDSSMWVSKKQSDDWTVRSPGTLNHRVMSGLRETLMRGVVSRLFNDPKRAYRSYNAIPSNWLGKLNASDAQLIHLIWVNGETLSIRDIARLRKPIIMNLSDMWAFCGAEHYSEDLRYAEAYSKSSKPEGFSGFDIDRWVWRRKSKYWSRPFPVVAISQWLADCAQTSSLFSDWPITVIPNPVDVACWKPLDKNYARHVFKLPQDKRIVLFGALGGTSNPRKGYEYLDDALAQLSKLRRDIHLVVYGQSTPEKIPDSHFPITYVGQLKDSVALCTLNSAADVFVTPAVQEAFGQTASEAHACGLPVVAFRDTGIADIVEHKHTGYLARLRDADDLCKGLSWVMECLDSTDKAVQLSTRARQRAESLFSYESVGTQYRALYEQTVAQHAYTSRH